MSEFKLFAQRMGLVGVTNFLSSISGIFLLPILSKNLSIGDYGIWAQVNVTLVLVSYVMLLGLPNSMIRFMASLKEREAVQEGFYSILTIAFFCSLISAILAYIFSNQLSYALFDNNMAVVALLPLVVLIDPVNNTL